MLLIYLMSFDLSIITNRINHFHVFAISCSKGDGLDDVLDLVVLEVEGDVEADVAGFVLE